MLNKTEFLPIPLLLCIACSTPPTEDPLEQAPAPIGPELLHSEGTWALPGCASVRLYRLGRELQYQCFDYEGSFSWENRGTLSPEASDTLDMAIAAADSNATEPVNYMGLCGNPDGGGTLTLWVEDQSLSFAPWCLFEGILPLYEEVLALWSDVANCDEPFARLESVEPGCRAY